MCRLFALAMISFQATFWCSPQAWGSTEFDLCLSQDGEFQNVKQDDIEKQARLEVLHCSAALQDQHLSSKQRSSAHNNRGRSLNVLTKDNEALADFSEAIRLNPNNYFAYNNRSIIFMKRGDLDLALSDYNMIISESPFAAAYLNRAFVWLQKGDKGRAKADANEAIRLVPEYASAYRARARIERSEGNIDAAIADLRRSLKYEHQISGWYVELSHTLIAKERFIEAIQAIDGAIALEPKNIKFLRERATLKQLTGDISGSMADDKTIREIGK